MEALKSRTQRSQIISIEDTFNSIPITSQLASLPKRLDINDGDFNPDYMVELISIALVRDQRIFGFRKVGRHNWDAVPPWLKAWFESPNRGYSALSMGCVEACVRLGDDILRKLSMHFDVPRIARLLDFVHLVPQLPKEDQPFQFRIEIKREINRTLDQVNTLFHTYSGSK